MQEFYNYKGQLDESITYAEGIKNGKHTQLNSDGTLFFDISYLNGKKTGPFKETPEGFKDEYYVLDEGYYDENEKLTGQFSRSLKNGEEVIRLGKMNNNRIIIKSGTYVAGDQVGVWKTFDEKGELTKEVNFSDNQKDLYVNKEYFGDSKNLQAIVEYDREKDEGFKKVYYPNG